MTMPNRQPARAYLDAYRARCVERNLDPATGGPRVFAWPAERQQPEGRPWWADGDLWNEPGEAHSSTEREALASISAQARAATGRPEPVTLAAAMEREFRAIVREVFAEQIPLRELHRRRGVEVVMLEGVRMEVPIKGAA